MSLVPANGQTSEQRAEYNRRYYADPANVLKRNARGVINNRIKRGTLAPQPCEQCGEPETQAHHEDYSKPLEVKWLCRKCHGATHRRSHCIHGHALSDDNIRIAANKRQCLQCARNSEAAYRQRKRNKSQTA